MLVIKFVFLTGAGRSSTFTLFLPLFQFFETAAVMMSWERVHCQIVHGMKNVSVYALRNKIVVSKQQALFFVIFIYGRTLFRSQEAYVRVGKSESYFSLGVT